MSNMVIPDPYDDEEDEIKDVIVKNAIRCLECGDEVESTYRHDFAVCKCGKNFTDGGHDYLRRGGDSFEDISIIAPDEPRTHTLEHTDVELVNVHHSALCAGRPCTIHNRSDHRLRAWPQEFAEGRMFRVCEHQVLHRDPDEISRKRCKSCDGCCRKENFA